MKRILITGTNSYVGTSFEKWILNHRGSYSIETVSLREESWKENSFEGFDVVLHTVGIAHVEAKPEMESLYYKVNRDLTIETAQKAKKDGVKQFIFMSSIIVYGDSSNINKPKKIDKYTVPIPVNFYGKSKIQAEEGIIPLINDDFNIAIIRAPMIYGKGSKGNYPKLARIGQHSPVFPNIENQRSMLHIDNLSEFIRLIINNEESGIFHPQNDEYVKTSEMVKLIAEAHNKKIILTKIFNPILRGVSKNLGVVNKVFGNLVYDQSLSDYKQNYRVRDLKESIIETEK